MKTLYLILDGLTILFPLLLSFDKKVAFYKTWNFVFIAFLMVGIPFIAWDVLFTKIGVWGFNANYLTEVSLFNLPVEEALFFVVVPFACVFIFACVKAYFSKLKLEGFNRIFYALLIIYAIVVLVVGWGGYYSMSASILTLISIPFLLKLKVNLRFLPLSFLIALIPFFIVNGVLTGTGLEEPIVWYNDLENVGVRLYTIPVEDVLYGWVLITLNILVYQHYLERSKKN